MSVDGGSSVTLGLEPGSFPKASGDHMFGIEISGGGGDGEGI